MTLESLMAFSAIVFVLAVIPGPNALLVLFTALSNNRLMAFANVAGVALGFVVHAFISALGLSLIVSHSAVAFMVLKWVGVVYLLWLGWSHLQAGLSSKPHNFSRRNQIQGLMRNFMKGLLTNLLNPKIVLFYLSIFPQFVNQDEVFVQSLVLGVAHAFVVSAWFSVVILLAQSFRQFLTTDRNARWLNVLSGSIFIAFGAKLATAKV